MFSTDIDSLTIVNPYYRNVVSTVPRSMQLVVMNLVPGEDIPKETHDNTTQFIKIVSGTGIVVCDKMKLKITEGWGTIIPPGTSHYIKNTSETDDLKLYTIYTPPEHNSLAVVWRQHE